METIEHISRSLGGGGASYSGGGILSGFPIMHEALSKFFVQCTIIIVWCRGLSILGHHLKQPTVIFEIIGGILLGPSGLMRGTQPDMVAYRLKVFPKKSLEYLNLVANIGLVFYLFLVGMELDPKMMLTHARKAGWISIVGIGLPFGLGVAISRILFDTLQGNDPEFEHVNFTAFWVFIGTAMSITAFPVLARILKEGGLIYTKAGALVMGAAAIDDAIAWCLLILAISIANAGDMGIAGYVFLTVIAFAFGLFVIVRPLFEIIVKKVESWESPAANRNLFAFTLCCVLVCAWTTALLGVHHIFGAFIFGLIVPRDSHLYKECHERMEELTLVFFLPLYFTYSGLGTDITQLTSKDQGGMIVLVCFIATVGKFVGCGGVALLSGMTIRESAVIGTLMNTRGLIELIVLNLGKNAGLLSTKTFSVMVIMCLFTTFSTTPVVDFIYPMHMRNRDREAAKREEEEGEEVNLSLDTDATALSKEMRLVVAVDAIGQVQWLMNVLTGFAVRGKDSFLNVAAIKFEEPTQTEQDEFLGLSRKGALVLTEEESTNIEDLFREGRKPKLLPLTMFCKALGSEVCAYQVRGSPQEFPVELRTITHTNTSDMVLMPWRDSEYLERLFWGSIRSSIVPIALVAAVTTGGDSNGPGRRRSVSGDSGGHETLYQTARRLSIGGGEGELPMAITFTETYATVHKVVAVVMGKITDIYILPIATRFAKQLDIEVVVLVTNDHKSFDKEVKSAYTAFKKSAPQLAGMRIEVLACSSIDTEELIRLVSEHQADLVVASFIEPLHIDPSAVQANTSSSGSAAAAAATIEGGRDSIKARSNSLSAAIASSIGYHDATVSEQRRVNGVPEEYVNSIIEHPELGLLGSRLVELGTYPYVMTIHESTLRAKARRNTLQSIGSTSMEPPSADGGSGVSRAESTDSLPGAESSGHVAALESDDKHTVSEFGVSPPTEQEAADIV